VIGVSFRRNPRIPFGFTSRTGNDGPETSSKNSGNVSGASIKPSISSADARYNVQ